MSDIPMENCGNSRNKCTQQFVLACFKHAVNDVRLHNNWLSDDILLKIIHQLYNIGAEIPIKRGSLLRCINKVCQNTMSTPNQLEMTRENVVITIDVYRREHQANRRKMQFFYFTKPGRHPPPFAAACHNREWQDDKDFINQIVLAQASSTSTEIILSPLTEPANKKQKISGESVAAAVQVVATTESVKVVATTESGLTSFNYWQSGDARLLFAPKEKYGTTCDVRQVVIERIELLEQVNHKPTSWRLVVGGEEKDMYTCTEHDKFIIRHRSTYLAIALRQFVAMVATSQAHGGLTKRWTWKDCCNYSIEVMDDIGIHLYANHRTLARWHRRLALHPDDAFSDAPSPKSLLSRFFLDNPDAMDAFKKFGTANLQTLSIEKMHEYVHEHLIPTLIGNLEQGDDDNENEPQQLTTISQETKDAFLETYGLSKVTMSTILRWMHAVGFRYKSRQKHYFVDGHEEPETIAYRPLFTKHYLTYKLDAH